MKCSFKNILLYAFAFTLFFSSCEPEEEAIPPSIKIQSIQKTAIEKGATISFPLEVTALEKIQSIKVVKIKDAEEVLFEKTDAFNSSTKHSHTFDYLITGLEDTVDLRFEVVDKLGALNTSSHRLVVTPIAIPDNRVDMNYINIEGVISNKKGEGQSAFDLATNVRRSTGAATADLQNHSNEGWIKGWEGVRKTTFVKADPALFDKEQVTVNDAIVAFIEGDVMSSVENVVVGEVYVAKIKGGANYAVIKINSVDEAILTENSETITFSYKKAVANSGL